MSDPNNAPQSFVSLSSILTRVRGATKARAYQELSTEMAHGRTIPGVEYKRATRMLGVKSFGWQIRLDCIAALEHHCENRGHVFPYKLPKAFVPKVVPPKEKPVPVAPPAAKEKPVKRDPYFDPDPSLIVEPVPKSYNLPSVKAEDRKSVV